MVDVADGDRTGSSQEGTDEHVVEEHFIVDESELQALTASIRADIQLSPASILNVRLSS
jgi:hypothetical protein